MHCLYKLQWYTVNYRSKITIKPKIPVKFVKLIWAAQHRYLLGKGSAVPKSKSDLEKLILQG